MVKNFNQENSFEKKHLVQNIGDYFERIKCILPLIKFVILMI